MNRVAGKVALITGGASGLGRSACLLLAREGAKVVVTDLRDAEGAAVVKEIQCNGGAASFLHHDVTSEAEWISVIERTVALYGRLDVLVNNAGIGSVGNAEELSLEDWHKVMSVNLDGVFLGVKHGIPAMRKSGCGSIVNISSIAGIVGGATMAAYNASKGGVRLLTKSAALHCATTGAKIRVNSIHPGYIWTPLLEEVARSLGEVDAVRRNLDALHPIGHVGQPDDIGWGVVYLASDESKFVTGSELIIDGGYTAQ